MPHGIKSKTKRKISGKKSDLSQFIRIQIVALIIYILIFLLYGFICLKVDLNSDHTFIVAISMFFISSFLVGFISCTKIRQKGLVSGVLYAVPMNSISILISLVMNGFKPDLRAAIIIAVMLVSSASGGIISVNTKVRK